MFENFDYLVAGGLVALIIISFAVVWHTILSTRDLREYEKRKKEQQKKYE